MDFVKEALKSVPVKVDSVTPETKVRTKKKRESMGMYLPRNASKRARGILCSKLGIWDRRKEYDTRYDQEVDTLETPHYSPEE